MADRTRHPSPAVGTLLRRANHPHSRSGRPPRREAPASPLPPPGGGNQMRVLRSVFAALLTVAGVVFAFSAFLRTTSPTAR